MKRKDSLILLSIFAIFILAGLLPDIIRAQGNAQRKQARFDKAGNRWKIRAIHASKDDIVTWTDAGSDLYFHFMDDSVFGVETQFVSKGDTLKLAVKTTKNGVYPYAIFRTADSSFVTGDSPPKIIIP